MMASRLRYNHLFDVSVSNSGVFDIGSPTLHSTVHEETFLMPVVESTPCGIYHFGRLPGIYGTLSESSHIANYSCRGYYLLK